MSRSPPAQRRRLEVAAAGGEEEEDRLSALPDDLLMVILHRMDTRSALTVSVLARRWVRLPRRLRVLNFSVNDILQPEYHQTVALAASGWNYRRLLDAIEGYAGRALARFIDGIHDFLQGGGGRLERRVDTLRLEFFDPDVPVFVDRLISTAVIDWGVVDVEVVVMPLRPIFSPPSGRRKVRRIAYRFPHDSLPELYWRRIRSLMLGGIAFLPPLENYGELTKVVLQDISRPMRSRVYADIISRCPQLRTVHLRRCLIKDVGINGTFLSIMEVNAPASELRELVVDDCTLDGIHLVATPMLERLACTGEPLMLVFADVSRLLRVSLSFCTAYSTYDDEYAIGHLMGGGPVAMTDLIVRFTGLTRWVLPGIAGGTVYRALRRLLVADVPSTWDASWPCIFLDVAPALEVLHASAARGAAAHEASGSRDAGDITWPPSRFRHYGLRELLLVGFERAPRRACLLRYAMKVCVELQRVVMVKGGRINVNGIFGGWEVVTSTPTGGGAAGQCPWSDEEKLALTKEIKEPRYFKQHGRLIFA